MKELATFLVPALLLPQVAFAAWWNPASWIKNKQSASETTQEVVEDVQAQEDKVVPQPKEKIVEKVITVIDPNLQAQINELIKENAELKAKLNSQVSIVQQLNQCKADLVNKPAAYSSEYADKKVKWENMDVELNGYIDEILNNYQTMRYSEMKHVRQLTNDLISAYKYIDSKVTLTTIADYSGSETRENYRKAYENLRKQLEWYVKYR